ncbi:MAG: SDR family NAD(P)-dependent oxidoreductase [Acidimicrobiales bacterium]
MSAFRDVPVLVTGADGFIGSHLVERLLAEGAAVRALCLYNPNGAHGWLDEVDPDLLGEVDLRLGDIRDQGFVEDAVRGVDVVLHLAALIAIPYSYLAPASFVDTNVSGTLHVLEAARRARVGRVIHTSTSEVYGTPATLPITEDHPLRAQSPYSASKIAADKLCEAWAFSFDVPVVIMRPFNTYGPRQSARAVIPTILGQLLAGVERVRLGSLHPRRDFTFVTDSVDGFVRMASAELEPGETIQLGTGTAVSVGELFDLCCQVVGVEAHVDLDDERVRPRESEVQVLVSDPTKAKNLLGWGPSVSLRDGLSRCAEWMKGRVNPRTAGIYQR